MTSPHFRLEWKGDKLLERVAGIVPRAMDDTTAAASIQAKGDHPGWHNRTGTAEGSIRGEPARRFGPTLWRALFGSFDVNYFLWLEIGARGRAGDRTLQRAADREFPRLGQRIRALLGAR